MTLGLVTDEPRHAPVLFNEALGFMRPGVHWDGTLGLGGHAIGYLNKFPDSHLVGSDADLQMLALAKEALKNAQCLARTTLLHGNYSEIEPEANLKYDSILLDLGISSLHLDSLPRGITYRFDQPLDMRLNTQNGEPLSTWLNRASEYEIRSVIHRYGEEPAAPRIAREIIKERENKPIETTFHLTSIIRRALPPSRTAQRGHVERHPEVRTYQAFRIHTNSELEHLEKALHRIPDFLQEGGRLIIISFHSLEDRLVKNHFRSLERIAVADPLAKSNWKQGQFQVLTPKPIVPAKDEIELNPRSRSAKMRVLEKRGENHV